MPLLPSVISAGRQMNCTDCQRHRVLALVNTKAPILVSQATTVSLCCIELILSGSAWKLWHAFINAVIAMRSPPRRKEGDVVVARRIIYDYCCIMMSLLLRLSSGRGGLSYACCSRWRAE